MLLILTALTAWAGVTLTPAQVLTDVEVACNYTGNRVRVLVPDEEQAMVELLAETCAEVKPCSARGQPREILDWHGRKGTCAIYYRADGPSWYSEALGFCGPVAAGRQATPLVWPPVEVDLQAWCARDPVHPACLLDPTEPVAWHGPCPPNRERNGRYCLAEDPLLARGDQVEWPWSWGQDALHPPSVALPPRTWEWGSAGISHREGVLWSPLTGCRNLAPWVFPRSCDTSRATGRAPGSSASSSAPP